MRIAAPLTRSAKKPSVWIQCVTRIRTVCRGIGEPPRVPLTPAHSIHPRLARPLYSLQSEDDDTLQRRDRGVVDGGWTGKGCRAGSRSARGTARTELALHRNAGSPAHAD